MKTRGKRKRDEVGEKGGGVKGVGVKGGGVEGTGEGGGRETDEGQVD